MFNATFAQRTSSNRLSSSLGVDNRPLNFQEFETRIGQAIYFRHTRAV